MGIVAILPKGIQNRNQLDEETDTDYAAKLTTLHYGAVGDPEQSCRKLLPGFVIPAGTQVVRKVGKALPDGRQFKPPGSVGVVLECPPLPATWPRGSN